MPFDFSTTQNKDEQGGVVGNLKGLANFLNPINLFSGVAGMGKEAVDTVKETSRAIPTFAYGLLGNNSEQGLQQMDSSPLSLAVNTDAIRQAKADAPLADKLMAQINTAAPLVGHGASAVAQTGINLGDTLARGITHIPGVEPVVGAPMDFGQNPYVQAWNTGNLAPVAIGDLLNVALAGKGAAAETALNPIPESLGSKIASGAATAERVPFMPYTKAGQGLRDLTSAANAGRSIGETALGPRLPDALINAGDTALGGIGAIKNRGDIRHNLIARQAELVNPIAAAGADIHGLSKEIPIAEQEAAHLIAAGIPDSNLALAQQLPDAGPLAKMVTTPDSVSLAREYLAGNPEVKSGLDRVLTGMTGARDASEALYMSGQGMKGSSTIEQRRAMGFGDAPLSNLVERDLAKSPQGKSLAALDQTLEQIPAENVQGRLAVQSTRTDIERKLAEMRTTLEKNPDYAPANYRPALKVGEIAQKQAMSLAEEYRGQGRVAEADALEQAANEAITTLQQMTEQGDLGQQIGTAPRHIIGQAESAGGGAPTRNLATKKLGSEMQKKGIAADLSMEGQYNEMLRRAHDASVNVAKREIIDKYGQAFEGDLPRGFTEIDRTTGMPPKAVKADQPRPETVAIPDYVYKAMKDVNSPKTSNALLKAYDKGMAAVKLSWLPFSPKWQIGNVAGNSLMAGLGSGVGPKFLFDHYTEAKNLMKNPTPEAAQVLRRGLSEELVRDAGTSGKLRSAADFMFKGNQWVDDFGHVISYLKEKESALKGGMMDAAAGEQAVNRSLKVMGDFQNMSSIERDVVRRVMPFYPWYRHITKLAFNLPIDSPARLAWTLHLADEFDPNKGKALPDYLRGSIPFGETGQEKFLRAPWNPFPGGTADSPLINPASALGGLTPLIQWPTTISTGFNPGTGKMLTKGPTPNKAADDAGWLNPGQAAGFLTNQFPQARLIADLLDRRSGQDAPARLGTREALVAKGKVIPQTTQDLGPIPAPLVQFLTGASVDKPDLKSLEKRQTKSDKQKVQDAKKYDKTVKRSGY